jgi:hypothetical protein
MPDIFKSKSEQCFHLCDSAENFNISFNKIFGIDPKTFVREHFVKTEEFILLISGSIPLGIGSKASDLDFVVLVNNYDDILIKDKIDDSQVLHSTSMEWQFSKFVCTLVLRGAELDFEFISYQDVQSAIGRINKGSYWPSENEVRILDRIKNGWLLAIPEGDVSFDLIKKENFVGLEIQCLTKDFVVALKYMEDATASIEANSHLACYLARFSIEHASLCYLASFGYCNIGKKWILFLQHCTQSGMCDKNLEDEILKLLFENTKDANFSTQEYLKSISELLARIKDQICRKKKLHNIAFATCPQIYDPDRIVS